MTMNNHMNRKERRAAFKRGAIFVDRGHLQPRDPNYGLPVKCYVCGADHKAYGLTRVEDKRSILDAPLCDVCLAGDPHDHQIIRKFLNAPDLNVSEVTTEQLTALAEKQSKTEH